MRRAYWLLLVLAIWCTACAIWYMFAVKGIPTDPAYFRPQPTLIAIAEICVMLLIACLIGYGIASSVRGQDVLVLEDMILELEREKGALVKAKQELEGELASSRERTRQDSHRLQDAEAALIRSEESHQRQRNELELELSQVKAAALQPRVPEETENELKSLRYRVRQLEFENKELQEAIEKLKLELESSKHSRHREVEPTHPFVRPVSLEERDDLTMIKGIGPFIEKRLNMLGIFTFQQISEFTPEIMEQVSRAIEFFPKRMQRDDWVGQAKKLLAAD